MYGLCDTPRACYLSLKQELIKTGETKSKYDGTIFYRHNGSKWQGILSSHVDSFFLAGTSWFFPHVRDHFWKTFAVSKDDRETFKYLSLQIQQKKNNIEILQKGYIEDVEAIQIDNPSQINPVLLPYEAQELRRVAS